MYCLKCGRETKDNKIFCAGCLDNMELYPVKPGTAIQLPQRAPKAAPKKPVKREPSPEEQLVSLRRYRFWLTIAVILLSAALCCALLFLRPAEDAPAETIATTEATEDVSRETSEATIKE